MTSSTSSRPLPSPSRTCVCRLAGTSPIVTYLMATAFPASLEVAPQRLLALDRLEQRLEVALAEAARAVALDDLEEDRRAVAERLREDLQQVALVVSVDEDAEAAQVLDRLVDLADALGHAGVVGVGRAQEAHPAG